MRLCVMCKHFEVSEGGPGYSEMTPGWDARIGCGLYWTIKPGTSGPWQMDNFDVDTERFRQFNKRAESCDKYVEAE